MNDVTRDQVRAYLAATRAIADAIKELGSTPSGHVYATVMGHMDFETYQGIVTRLCEAKLIEKKGNVLTWIA